MSRTWSPILITAGFGPAHLKWMFTTFLSGPYMPLTWLSFAFDYRLWGMNPFGYHLTNLALHALNAGLFYLLALRLLWFAILKLGRKMGMRLRKRPRWRRSCSLFILCGWSRWPGPPSEKTFSPGFSIC